MKRLVVVLFLLLSFWSTADATPYITEDARIGSVKAGRSFWGHSDDGGYFEGITYINQTELKIPDSAIKIEVRIRKRDCRYQYKERTITRSFDLVFSEPIEKFSGKIRIYIQNPNEEIFAQRYEGQENQKDKNFTYEEMNLNEAQAGAKLAVGLILEDGELIEIPVPDEISWQWGLIANLTVSIGSPLEGGYEKRENL